MSILQYAWGILMSTFFKGLLAASFLAMAAVPADATSLAVSPISVEVTAPGASSRVTLENAGTEPLIAQVRIFKWVQNNGRDELVATRDIVASPPVVKIQPGGKNVVRVVRTSKQPITVEETYRLLVSEVPSPDDAGKRSVALTIQHSIPVFFVPSKGASELSWNARLVKGKLFIEAANAGTRRAKLTALSIGLPGGKKIEVAEGLAGYVLPDSRKIWVARSGNLKSGSQISIIAKSEQGPVNATASVAGQ
jgi:fimbrial chaperone protein